MPTTCSGSYISFFYCLFVTRRGSTGRIFYLRNPDGDARNIYSSVSLVNVPFEVSIYGDTDNAAYLGNVAGAGELYANNSLETIWLVDGFGTAQSSSVQIYTIPGIGRVGFSWDGIAYPIDSSLPAPKTFDFVSGKIATDIQYGRINSIVDPVSLNLVTSLENPPGALPQYTTSMYFGEAGILTLKEITNLSYQVTAVPPPSAVLLFCSGFLGLVGISRQNYYLIESPVKDLRGRSHTI